MSITSATIQSEEASHKRFDAIVFSFSFVVVMFLTPFAILMKNGRYLRALQAKTAIVHHLVMGGSCIALSSSCGISLVVLKTSSGMSSFSTVFNRFLPDCLDCFAPSSFQLFISEKRKLYATVGLHFELQGHRHQLLNCQAENRL
jgi:hypothetical protein